MVLLRLDRRCLVELGDGELSWEARKRTVGRGPLVISAWPVGWQLPWGTKEEEDNTV